MAAPLTRALGAFVSGLTRDALPDKAAEVACVGFTDLIGCMIAGRMEPAVRILQEVIHPAGEESTVHVSGRRASAQDAAWINGTAGHVLDFDDAAMRGHPSAVLVPAILALGEWIGASGAKMITAYVAGYETWGELVRRDPGQHHMKGLHPTGIFGAVGSAAACASLLSLDPEKASHAIALGASQSAGLMSNFGSMAKPYHAGRAAHSGIVAVRLAAAGFSGSGDALEHPQGFLSAFSPKGEVDFDAPVEAGRDWQILRYGLSLKKYPMCYCAHRPIDAALDLRTAYRIDADAIESIAVEMSGRNARVLRNHRPQTGLEAKFSIEFAMACAFIAGRVGLPELQDSFVQRADVQQMMQCVQVSPDPREDPMTGYAPHDRVVLRMRDGREFISEPVTVARGAWEAPLSMDEIWSKFEACLEAGRYEGDDRVLFDALMSLDTVANGGSIPGLRGMK